VGSISIRLRYAGIPFSFVCNAAGSVAVTSTIVPAA
jgi:hypothetical protein